jgi:hypothetical protein
MQKEPHCSNTEALQKYPPLQLRSCTNNFTNKLQISLGAKFSTVEKNGYKRDRRAAPIPVTHRGEGAGDGTTTRGKRRKLRRSMRGRGRRRSPSPQSLSSLAVARFTSSRTLKTTGRRRILCSEPGRSLCVPHTPVAFWAGTSCNHGTSKNHS